MVFKQAYKQRLLETFDFTSHFLDSHGLSWWGAYGTCIGAVRHHGLIPWDDDIDLYMLRSDYEKLFSLRDELKSHGYSLISSRDNTNSNCFFKICNMNTSLLPNKEDPFDTGIFIDIFPLDNFDGGDKQFNKFHNQFRKWLRIYKFTCMKVSGKEIIRDLKNGQLQRLIKKIVRILTPSFIHRHALSVVNNMERSFCETEQSDQLASFFGPYGHQELYKKEWFDDYIKIPYEGRDMRLPKMYDEYLRSIYGNYMKFPDIIPESTHAQYYVNLKERISINEIYNRAEEGLKKEW